MLFEMKSLLSRFSTIIILIVTCYCLKYFTILDVCLNSNVYESYHNWKTWNFREKILRLQSRHLKTLGNLVIYWGIWPEFFRLQLQIHNKIMWLLWFDWGTNVKLCLCASHTQYITALKILVYFRFNHTINNFGRKGIRIIARNQVKCWLVVV